MSESIDQKSIMVHQGEAVSINISSGGMLLLLAQAPQLQQVLEVQVPTPYDTVSTRTLAEVRWTRQIPADADNSMYLAGVKFLFGRQASSSEIGVEHPV